jgi:hypothetical protein
VLTVVTGVSRWKKYAYQENILFNAKLDNAGESRSV